MNILAYNHGDPLALDVIILFGMCISKIHYICVLLITGMFSLEIASYFYLDKPWQNMLSISFSVL